MKNLYLILAGILFFVLTGTAQEIQWQNTIGGDDDDTFSSMLQSNDGGYLIGGHSRSSISGDKVETGNGLWDYWVVKTDSLGNIQWQNTIGGNNWDFLASVLQTADNGFVLGGWSNSDVSGDKIDSCLGNLDFWVVKIDSVGNVQWQKTLGGTGVEICSKILLTIDGGYIVGGYSNSPMTGNKSENCIGGYDYWIVKIDSVGNVLWDNTIGGNYDDRLSSIIATTDGGYILCGDSESDSIGDKSENSNGGVDFWIVKTDSGGIVQWQNTIGGNSWDLPKSICQTDDNGYVIGGYSRSNISGDKTENNRGPLNTYDFWLVKIDSVGFIQWQKTIGGDDFDYLNSVQITDDGGYALGGSSQSFLSGEKTEVNTGYSNYWVLKLDSTGNIQWQNVIGGDSGDGIFCLFQNNQNKLLLGGVSTSSISGDKSEICFGENDYWVMELSAQYNFIAGKVFADLNTNGLLDSGEPLLQGKKVVEQSTGRFAFSQTNGQYSVAVLDTGNYTVLTPSPLWYNPIPPTHSATFTGINQTDSLNDFAFQPTGNYDDVSVTISPLSAFRSGSNATYQITFGNFGTTTITPTVVFYPDTNLTFQAASISPSLITSDSVMWSLSALTPFQTGSIVITVNVDPGLLIGTLINSSARIDPLLTDANPTDNTANWPVYTSGSYDPNDIIVNKTVLTTTELSTAPWLEYIIRFQNTGNDTAFTVKILNPIDTNKLDISSIEFVNASHPVNINWINYQRNMEFKFDNILLPDSTTNEPLSHGFVRYRIQPKTTLSAGDTIPNFAAIYFDFNDPVITNTAKTIIVLPTGLDVTSPAPGKLLVFPNPAENSITVSGLQLESGKAQLRLMDIYGKLILEKTISETSANLETNQLAKGVYLIQSGGSRATFVKQ